MSAPYPVLPVAGGALLRAFASLVALVTYWLKELARARRHRREANALARLDRRMLADLVHACVGQAKIDYRAELDEKATIGCPATGRRLSWPPFK